MVRYAGAAFILTDLGQSTFRAPSWTHPSKHLNILLFHTDTWPLSPRPPLMKPGATFPPRLQISSRARSATFCLRISVRFYSHGTAATVQRPPAWLKNEHNNKIVQKRFHYSLEGAMEIAHSYRDMITTIAKNGIRKHDRAIENLLCNREVRELKVCIRTCASEHNEHHFCDRETRFFWHRSRSQIVIVNVNLGVRRRC